VSTRSNTRISLIGLACALMAATGAVRGDEAAWPQFRGPDSNPVSTNARLPEKWGKAENVEWSAEIPGRGWSSPIVTGEHVLLTSATTDGPSKPPQIGTEYSNEYVAELTKQGLSEAQVLEKVTARDIELPAEVQLHYVLSCRNLKTGKLEWQREFYAGRPPGGRHRKNSFVSEPPATAFTSSPWAYNGKVFFLSKEGRTFVVAAGETFQLLHVNELDDMALASPALAGDRLVLRTEHRLYSIRRSTPPPKS
jgi:hypothetical protein